MMGDQTPSLLLQTYKEHLHVRMFSGKRDLTGVQRQCFQTYKYKFDEFRRRVDDVSQWATLGDFEMHFHTKILNTNTLLQVK